MGFLGVWQGSLRARALIEARADYLYASALRLSMDRRVLLCYDDLGDIEEPFSYLFCAVAGSKHAAEAVVRSYQRYGRHFMRRSVPGGALVLYDSRAGRLYLHGGTSKVFLEQMDDAIFFSSERYLLRQGVCADVAILR